MVITYLGKQFFKVGYGDTVLAFNPIGKDSKSGVSPSRFGANVALTTTHYKDYDGIDQVSHGETVPFVIDGPGDYEVKGIFVNGVASESKVGGTDRVNTIYMLTLDSISICFLGAISDEKISNEAREAIDTPDIVFVPIGGKGTLDASAAYKLASSFDPKIIIPMDYGDDMEGNSLKIFLKEAGEEKIEPVEKLTVKRKDLEGKESDVVVLSY